MGNAVGLNGVCERPCDVGLPDDLIEEHGPPLSRKDKIQGKPLSKVVMHPASIPLSMPARSS